MSKNPFVLSVISPDAAFCNRTVEIDQLVSYASSGTNVVLYSPRRYGKTSLVRRVQAVLAAGGILTLYTDYFGVASIEDVAARIAKSVYEFIQNNEPLMKKAIRILSGFRPVFRPTEDGSVSISIETTAPNLFGLDLLDKTLKDLGTFIEEIGPAKVHIVFDEFQEITELKDKRLEATFRSHIQFHQCAYFFVGSRRHLLLGIFSESKRPFYQSAQLYELNRLPHDDLVEYLTDQFKSAGKICSKKTAEKISELSSQYPYYAQKLALNTYEISGKSVRQNDVSTALEVMIKNETYFYEATLQALAPRQIALLRALANEPAKSLLSNRYISKHDLGSIGGVQSALKKLRRLDLIEKGPEDQYRIVDPIFGIWLRRL